MSYPNDPLWPEAQIHQETPFFVLFPERLRKRYLHFSKIGNVCYPVKTNCSPDTLRELASLGAGFGVDTANHATLVVDLDIPADKVWFGLPIVKPDELRRTAGLGINKYIVDSIGGYERAKNSCPNAAFLVRLTVGSSPDRWKWGADWPEAMKLLRRIRRDGGICDGVSFHLCEDEYTAERFRSIVAKIIDQFGPEGLSVVDIGGGLEDSDTADFSAQINLLKAKMGVWVMVEPGRNLIGPAVDLIVSVIDVVRRESGAWAYIDCGIYSGLLDAVLRKQKQKYEIERLDTGRTTSPAHEYLIAGPSADIQDTIGIYGFDRPLSPGDRLVFRGMGAYTQVMATTFAGFPPPQMIVANSGVEQDLNR